MRLHKFTIITATLNPGHIINQLSDSLSQQTYKNFEWLIADGGSNNNFIDCFKNNKIAKIVVSEPDNGHADAWNKALLNRTGDWVIFMGADDFFVDSNVLEDVNNFINKFNLSDAGVIHGKVISGNKIVGQQIKKSYKKMIEGMNICHQATFHNSKIYDEIGVYNTKFSFAADYELLLRYLVLNKNDFIFIDRLISNMGQDGMSTNIFNGLSTAMDSYNARKINNLPLISIYFLKHFFKGFLIKSFQYILGKKITSFIYQKYKNVR
ncbi:MAG: hypothetical protein RLY43_944 [Bacteroidota bacterium]|jgi:glycosyltransferase involved in cell wall biosynthesis